LIVNEGQVESRFELVDIHLGFNLEDPVDLEVRPHIKAENTIGDDLPGILVSGIRPGASSIRWVAFIPILDYRGVRRV